MAISFASARSWCGSKCSVRPRSQAQSLLPRLLRACAEIRRDHCVLHLFLFVLLVAERVERLVHGRALRVVDVAKAVLEHERLAVVEYHGDVDRRVLVAGGR